MIKQTILYILLSLNAFCQLNTKRFAYIDDKFKPGILVFERSNQKIVPTGILNYNIEDENYSYVSDSGKVELKGIFYNNWYLVKSVSKEFIEIFTDSVFTRTIFLLKSKGIELNSSKYFFKKQTEVIVSKDRRRGAKFYEKPNDKSAFHQDSTRFMCFVVTKIKKEWIKVKLKKEGDMCTPKYEKGKINGGWVKWIDKSGMQVKDYYQ